MAYFGDPAQIKVINFIPVRMIGSQHPSAQRGSLSALGLGLSYSYDPPAIQHPYAVMSICDVQRHLVAAGKLPRSGVDGIWGSQSKNALYEFIKTMPLAAVRAVYTDNQNRGNVPPFGSREDYKQVSATQVRIPQAYVLAFPNKANVPCGSARTVTPDTVPPSTSPPPDGQFVPEAAPPSDAGPAAEVKEQGGDDAKKSGLPWGWIAGISVVSAVALFALWPRSEEESEASQE